MTVKIHPHQSSLPLLSLPSIIPSLTTSTFSSLSSIFRHFSTAKIQKIIKNSFLQFLFSRFDFEL